MGKAIIFLFVALFLVVSVSGYVNYDFLYKDEWLDATISLNQSGNSFVVGNLTVDNINLTGVLSVTPATEKVQNLDSILFKIRDFGGLFDVITFSNRGKAFFNDSINVIGFVNTTEFRIGGKSISSWNQINISGVSDHGDLSGLSDDDHNQYLLTNSTNVTTIFWENKALVVRG